MKKFLDSDTGAESAASLLVAVILLSAIVLIYA
jgi:hypothetical protein